MQVALLRYRRPHPCTFRQWHISIRANVIDDDTLPGGGRVAVAGQWNLWNPWGKAAWTHWSFILAFPLLDPSTGADHRSCAFQAVGVYTCSLMSSTLYALW